MLNHPLTPEEQKIVARNERNGIALAVLPGIIQGEYTLATHFGENVDDDEAFAQLCIDRAYIIAAKFHERATK